jgi:hypothetical protein
LKEELKGITKLSNTMTSLNEIISECVYQKKSNFKEVENQQKIIKKNEEETDNFNRQIVYIKLLLGIRDREGFGKGKKHTQHNKRQEAN